MNSKQTPTQGNRNMIFSVAITAFLLPVLFIYPGCATSDASSQPYAAVSDADAAEWETWVIESGDQFRLPAPPNEAESRNELAELQQLVNSLSDDDLMQIQFWNAGAPGYRWNQIAKQEAHNSDILLHAYRMISYLNVAIYDATIAAWDSKYAHNRPRPSVLNQELATVLPNPQTPSWPSEHAVAAGAAEAVITYFFPDRAERIRARAEEAAHAFVKAGIHYPSDAEAGLELGRQVGAQVVERAKTDGSDAVWQGERPTGYGIYNLPSFDDEMVGTWQTWVLTSGSEFRPPQPPAPDSELRKSEIEEILMFQEQRDAIPFMELFFWPEDPAGRPEPGSVPVSHTQVSNYYAPLNYILWLTELNQKLFEYRWVDNPPLAAYAYALVGVAYYDAFIATQDGRFAYWVARPEEMEPSINPILPTYHTPEYPSGHSAISNASTEVLAYLFPADAHYFRSRTRELAETRIWAGVHYRSSCEAGLELGKNVAQKVIEEKGMRNR